MSTGYWEILPFARVFLGDIKSSDQKYHDEDILTALRATTGTLAILGYDKSYGSDPDGVTGASLTEKEKVLWGKCAAVLLQDPDAAKASLEAVTVRTLGTSYSTEARARFMDAASSEAFTQLRAMIRALSSPMAWTRSNLDFDTLDTTLTG